MTVIDHAAVPEFATSDVCRLGGVTHRQLDYWTRTELVVPSIADARGSGSARRWSSEDVAYVRLISQLLRLGLDLARIRRSADELRLAVDSRAAKPYFVLTPDTARAVTVDELVGFLDSAPSTAVLSLSQVCAVDPDRDTGPAATGPVRKTSRRVSTTAAPVG